MKKICFISIIFLFISCHTHLKESRVSETVYNDLLVEEVEALEVADMIENVSTERMQDKINPTTWKRSNIIQNTPSLFVGEKEQLPIKGAQMAVSIDGFRARVLIDCFFFCDSERAYEGTFKMKLPQGASPYYLAFGESVYLDKTKKKDSIPFIEYEQIEFSPEKIEEMRSETWSEPKVARVVQK